MLHIGVDLPLLLPLLLFQISRRSSCQDQCDLDLKPVRMMAEVAHHTIVELPGLTVVRDSPWTTLGGPLPLMPSQWDHLEGTGSGPHPTQWIVGGVDGHHGDVDHVLRGLDEAGPVHQVGGHGLHGDGPGTIPAPPGGGQADPLEGSPPPQEDPLEEDR